MQLIFLVLGFIFRIQPLPAQELVFPPKVDLFKYSKSISEYSLYGFPDVRIWGWSNNGKVAYSIERGIEGRGGQIIDFIIFDSINDVIVFEFKMDSYEQNDVTDESLYNLFKSNILNTVKTHNIIEQKTEFLQFPIRKNNMVYYGNIIDTVYKKGHENFFDNTVISKYSVQVTAGSKKKIITTFDPVDFLTRWVYVCGYFLSPYENRALVVIAGQHWGFEGTELTYRFSGCHLGVGFN